MLKLVKPILSKISKLKLLPVPAPSVEVTAEAQTRYNADVRKEMKKKVWEKDGGVSWYVDQETGLCTVSSRIRSRFAVEWLRELVLTRSFAVPRRFCFVKTLYPWSQVHFWWKASWPKEADFKRLGM